MEDVREVLVANVGKRFTALYFKFLLDRNQCVSAKYVAVATL